MIIQSVERGATFTVIEYKPSKPTATYIAELGKRFNSLIGSCGSFSTRMQFQLWHGSFFEDSAHEVMMFDGKDWVLHDTAWFAGDRLGGLILESKNHRYDLEAKV
jgi:hypothetical protein